MKYFIRLHDKNVISENAFYIESLADKIERILFTKKMQNYLIDKWYLHFLSNCS